MIESKTTQEIDNELSLMYRKGTGRLGVRNAPIDKEAIARFKAVRWVRLDDHREMIERLIHIRNEWADLMVRFHQHKDGILEERELLKELDSLIGRADEQDLARCPKCGNGLPTGCTCKDSPSVSFPSMGKFFEQDDDPLHDSECEGSMCYCKNRRERTRTVEEAMLKLNERRARIEKTHVSKAHGGFPIGKQGAG